MNGYEMEGWAMGFMKVLAVFAIVLLLLSFVHHMAEREWGAMVDKHDCVIVRIQRGSGWLGSNLIEYECR